MGKKFFLIFSLLIVLLNDLSAQQNNSLLVVYNKNKQAISPGQIINLPFLVKNQVSEEKNLDCILSVPNGWKIIANSQRIQINPDEDKLVLFTIQSSSLSPIGNYNLQMAVVDVDSKDTLSLTDFVITINEIERITLLYVNSPQHVNAGEQFKATYLLQNLGNTSKKVFIETQNCDINGTSEMEVEAGKSVEFEVNRQTSDEIQDVKREYFNVRAIVSGDVKQSIYRFFTIYPTREGRKDLFFRFPVSATLSYVASNLQDKFEAGYQFQISGDGQLDPQGKHQFHFLARGPGLSRLSYLGLYDQYFVSYENKNTALFVGDKAYSFTPLTESSRYGFGTENRIILNNGIHFGFVYVKPKFFEGFRNEIAGYAGFQFNRNNEVKFYYVQKNNVTGLNPARLGSVLAELSPFKKSNLELEFSRGNFNEISDNAYRASLNAQFSIFYFAGIYFYTGKNYPGYYSNSTFYSGNISARVSEKLNLGVFAKEDFTNAELDTFFVSAPYTKSFQASINYNLAPHAYLKFYGRQFERKDRLVLDKFHYKTKSLNTQFDHKFRKIEYSLRGEFGETTNLLLATNNQQTTYRGIVDLGYRFNSRNNIKLTGSWSNINSFVSGENRNLTAGLFVNSQLTKNLKANLHIQNAYDIDDYYRNRNLMQFNLEYKFLKHHVITARSFYTLFKQHLENPEFTAVLSYTYNFGIPLKQIIKAGSIKGRITFDDDSPAEGIVLNLQNKSAITDKNGDFFINTIPPGRHLLTVDRSKFEIDEVTNIPSPVQVEVFQDQVSTVNFKITKGAKLSGNISIAKNSTGILNNPSINTNNIIVELKNDFDQFRIATDNDGGFSFPLVRPGNYIFKIYTSSVPDGYEVENSEFQFNFSPGEERDLQIELIPKKRTIIFKSSDTLIPVKQENEELKNPGKSAVEESVQNDSVFYSVQVGAFRKRQTNNSKFFLRRHFDFEIQNEGLYIYFIGKYNSFEEAEKERLRLATEFKNPFIVIFKNNVMQK